METPLLSADGLEILDDAECRTLLAQHDIGRVIVVTGGAAAVFPVSYGMVSGDIVFFTGVGTKFREAARSALVSFEVDSIDSTTRTGWSVLVVGTATLASPSLTARAAAVGICPWAAGARHHAVRIRPDFISGRRLA